MACRIEVECLLRLQGKQERGWESDSSDLANELPLHDMYTSLHVCQEELTATVQEGPT